MTWAGWAGIAGFIISRPQETLRCHLALFIGEGTAFSGGSAAGPAAPRAPTWPPVPPGPGPAADRLAPEGTMPCRVCDPLSLSAPVPPVEVRKAPLA